MCKHWTIVTSGKVIASRLCKRFPQAVSKQDDDWCGEFAAQEEQMSVVREEVLALAEANKRANQSKSPPVEQLTVVGNESL